MFRWFTFGLKNEEIWIWLHWGSISNQITKSDRLSGQTGLSCPTHLNSGYNCLLSPSSSLTPPQVWSVFFDVCPSGLQLAQTGILSPMSQCKSICLFWMLIASWYLICIDLWDKIVEFSHSFDCKTPFVIISPFQKRYIFGTNFESRKLPNGLLDNRRNLSSISILSKKYLVKWATCKGNEGSSEEADEWKCSLMSFYLFHYLLATFISWFAN